MPGVVFDAYALLAWLQDEPAAPTVERYLIEGETTGVRVLMSAVNLGEVYYLLVRRQGVGVADAFWRDVGRDALPLQVVPASWSRVRRAARLKARFPVSYADAFAAALALERSARLVTGDPDFRPMEGQEGLQVAWLS